MRTYSDVLSDNDISELLEFFDSAEDSCDKVANNPNALRYHFNGKNDTGREIFDTYFKKPLENHKLSSLSVVQQIMPAGPHFDPIPQEAAKPGRNFYSVLIPLRYIEPGMKTIEFESIVTKDTTQRWDVAQVKEMAEKNKAEGKFYNTRELHDCGHCDEEIDWIEPTSVFEYKLGSFAAWNRLYLHCGNNWHNSLERKDFILLSTHTQD